MSENSFEQYKQLAQEQARSLLDVVQSVAQGDLDVKVGALEGIPVLSELALGIDAMVDGLRETLAEQERIRTELEIALRQLGEIQARARREQALREIAARVRSFTDPDAVARAAARELGAALGRPAFIRLGSADELASGQVGD